MMATSIIQPIDMVKVCFYFHIPTARRAEREQASEDQLEYCYIISNCTLLPAYFYHLCIIRIKLILSLSI